MSRDDLANSVQVAGSDILFTVQFDRRGEGLPLINAAVTFQLKYQNSLILTRSISSGLTRTLNTADRQVISGVIPASATANLPNGVKLKYNWIVVTQGYTLGDESYQQSFTIKKF